MEAVLAIAIEDRVDLWFRDLEGAAEPQKFSKEIAEDSYYCFEIYWLIDELFRELRKSLPGNALELFNGIASVVVSIPGVIEEHRRLLQIPLWHADPHDTVQWNGKPYFDFGDELSEIAKGMIDAEGNTWSEPDREKFRDRIFVINDAGACAAFEGSRRKDEESDFVYLKAHVGINVGIPQRTYAGKQVNSKAHPEAGHGYPRLHGLDFDAGFEGVCPFHSDRGSCYEGMIAAHSFYKRIVETNSPVFNSWKRRLDELEAQKLSGQELDNALLQYVLGGDGRSPAGQGEGVELVAHYIAQLTYQISLLLAPKHIVIGGRMATTEVIDTVREMVVVLAGGYPNRKELSETGIAQHIVPSRADKFQQDTIEVQGALAIALSRAEL
jgi:predicted NBD/HSP70 family sugar kinase